MHEGDCKGERCAVRFKVRGVNTDWSEQGWEKDDWTRPLMSQTALTACKSGRDLKLGFSRQHQTVDLPY